VLFKCSLNFFEQCSYKVILTNTYTRLGQSGEKGSLNNHHIVIIAQAHVNWQCMNCKDVEPYLLGVQLQPVTRKQPDTSTNHEKYCQVAQIVFWVDFGGQSSLVPTSLYMPPVPI
jgi:hypothetical protein